jgi:hypothetical protein
LSEADAPAAKAEEARQAADKANRELEALWSEYQSLPDKADRISTKLARLKADRESLDAGRSQIQRGIRKDNSRRNVR